MTGLFQYINFPDEPAEFQSKDDELAQLRADLQAAQERIAELEDPLEAFSLAHDLSTASIDSPLLVRYAMQLEQRIARIDADNRTLISEYKTLEDRFEEQARQLAEARTVISAYRGLPTGPKGYTSYPLFDLHNSADEWIARNPAPSNSDHVHLSAGGKCVICGLPESSAEPQS